MPTLHDAIMQAYAQIKTYPTLANIDVELVYEHITTLIEMTRLAEKISKIEEEGDRLPFLKKSLAEGQTQADELSKRIQELEGLSENEKRNKSKQAIRYWLPDANCGDPFSALQTFCKNQLKFDIRTYLLTEELTDPNTQVIIAYNITIRFPSDNAVVAVATSQHRCKSTAKELAAKDVLIKLNDKDTPFFDKCVDYRFDIIEKGIVSCPSTFKCKKFKEQYDDVLRKIEWNKKNIAEIEEKQNQLPAEQKKLAECQSQTEELLKQIQEFKGPLPKENKLLAESSAILSYLFPQMTAVTPQEQTRILRELSWNKEQERIVPIPEYRTAEAFSRLPNPNANPVSELIGFCENILKFKVDFTTCKTTINFPLGEPIVAQDKESAAEAAVLKFNTDMQFLNRYIQHRLNATKKTEETEDKSIAQSFATRRQPVKLA